MLLIALGLGWLAGLTATLAFDASAWFAPVCVLLVLPLALALDGRRGYRSCVVASVAAIIASLNASTRIDDTAPAWSGLAGHGVIIEGHLVSEPDPSDSRVNYLLAVDRVISPAEIDGGRRILLVMPQYLDLRLGDSLTVRGELLLPPAFDEFDYRGYLREQRVFGTMFAPEFEVTGRAHSLRPDILTSRLRLNMERTLQRVLPEPQASLAAGIAFGRDEGLSSETKDAFRRSGLAHLIAVSGSNVTLLVLLISWLLAARIGRRRTLWLSVIAIAGYVLVAGASWSIIRAGVMATILVGTWFAGRQRDGVAALAAAFVAITLISPVAIRDPGFQLSFAAMGGILVFSPWLTAGLRRAGQLRLLRNAWFEPVIQTTSLSLAAWVATAPLIAYHFGQLTLIGILSNLVAAPLFVAAFTGSWLTILVATVSEPAGWLVGATVGYLPLASLTWLAETAARLPGSALDAGASLGATSAILLVLMLLAAPLHRILPPDIHPGRSIPRALLVTGGGGIAGIAAVFGLLALDSSDPGRLRIDILDAGQGDAILITTPGGAQLLVDGGPGGPVLANELGAVMPHFDRTLDAVLLTHGDEDHIGGVPEVLARYSVGTVYDNGRTRNTTTFAAYDARGGSRETFAVGRDVVVDGVRLEVLWPPEGFEPDEENESSIVIRMTYRGFSMLLTGDLQGEAMQRLAETTSLSTTVLKVPHHGSNTTDVAFINAVGPQLAVIPVGCENIYGHPGEQLMAALSGIDVVRTDLHGRIRIETDGVSVQVTTKHARDPGSDQAGPGACRR